MPQLILFTKQYANLKYHFSFELERLRMRKTFKVNYKWSFWVILVFEFFSTMLRFCISFFPLLWHSIKVNKWLDLNSLWKSLEAQKTSSTRDKKFPLSYTGLITVFPSVYFIVSFLNFLFYSVILPGSLASVSTSLFSWHFQWLVIPCHQQGILLKPRVWEQ